MAAKRADTLAMTSEACLFLPCASVTTAIAVGFEPLSWSPRLAPALLSTSAGRFAWTIVFSSALLEAAGFSLGTLSSPGSQLRARHLFIGKRGESDSVYVTDAWKGKAPRQRAAQIH
jgi:hypothetical protein